MGAESVQRRLAAILAGDVAGYSRLMGADEVGTLSALKAHRAEAIDPRLARFNGRVVKTTGDGILVEFPSVVDAVQCAVCGAQFTFACPVCGSTVSAAADACPKCQTVFE